MRRQLPNGRFHEERHAVHGPLCETLGRFLGTRHGAFALDHAIVLTVVLTVACGGASVDPDDDHMWLFRNSPNAI
jgi:hypothetical protein